MTSDPAGMDEVVLADAVLDMCAVLARVERRDRGCAFPECDRPPSWCDIHHSDEWEAGHGHTALANDTMLCRRHHTFIHVNGWTVYIGIDGKPVFVEPDGTIHTIRQTHRQPDAAYA